MREIAAESGGAKKLSSIKQTQTERQPTLVLARNGGTPATTVRAISLIFDNLTFSDAI
jgi:hypothetical protein